MLNGSPNGTANGASPTGLQRPGDFLGHLLQRPSLLNRQQYCHLLPDEHSKRQTGYFTTPQKMEDFHDDLEKFLLHMPILKTLTPLEIQRLKGVIVAHRFTPNQPVYLQGDTGGDRLFIILKGTAVSTVRDVHSFSVGESVILSRPVVFGEETFQGGQVAVIDKFDPAREYPYTITLRDVGPPRKRGRVLHTEIDPAPVDGAPKKLDKHLATLHPGDFFGEEGLTRAVTRANTIRAGPEPEGLTLAVLKRDDFRKFALRDRIYWGRRDAIVDHTLQPPPTNTPSKTVDDVAFLKNSILQNQAIRSLYGHPTGLHDDTVLLDVINGADLQPMRQGEVIIQQNDLNAEHFYIVRSGKVESTVDHSLPGSKHRNGDAYTIGHGDQPTQQGPGYSFGEYAMLHHCPRLATVRCIQQGELWVVHRASFKQAFLNRKDAKMSDYLSYFQNLDILNALLNDERNALAEAASEVHYMRGECILEQGKECPGFYFLLDGTVQFVKSDAQGNSQVTKSYTAVKGERKGEWFGDRALLKKQPCDASVVVQSDEAFVLAMSKKVFESLLGPIQDLLIEFEQKPERKSKVMCDPELMREQVLLQNVKLTDLRRIGLLGSGGFGTVTLEEYLPNKKNYALKALSKGYIVRSKMQRGVMREKQILSICNSPYVIRLFSTFRTADTLYFLLEPALGGELYATYHRQRFHGSHSKARFYSASVICAFQHLHERCVIYRDLKPENLLLDEKGFCKLTDMGLAKVVASKTYTTCGTTEYFAPEVVQQTGSTKAVDWWTLGILIHELLSGYTPFESNNSNASETYRRIIRGVSEVRFSYRGRDPEGVDLVTALLKFNPLDRIGMGPTGVTELKKHIWYDGFEFPTFEAFRLRPPYQPPNPGIQQFNAEGQASTAPYFETGDKWDKDFGPLVSSANLDRNTGMRK